MLAAGIRLRKELLGPDDDDDGDTILDVPISVDGSWQKPYGFNSLLGMVFLIRYWSCAWYGIPHQVLELC